MPGYMIDFASLDQNLIKHSSRSMSRPWQMLVDDIGDVTITNDGATILKLLEVEHPAAKVILQPLHAL